MPKPVCVKCECFYRPKKNGYAFIEGKPDNKPSHLTAEEIRGLRHPSAWTPYKLWNGDLWKCPDCGHEIVVGALHQVSEHYYPDWDEAVTKFNPQITVKDC